MSKSQESGRDASQRIASLDGLRAIAVGLVIAGHAGQAYLDKTTWWMAPLLNSSLGVRMFFVLSGYLITKLLIREKERYGQIDLGKFYLRRILRIFPAFYTFLLVVVCLAAFTDLEVSIQQFIGAGTYTWNYLARWHPDGPAEGAWFLGHLWTLSLEEQFYLIWPATLILVGLAKSRWIALAAPFVIPLIRVVVYFLFPAQRGQLGMMFHTAIDSILVGCAFALFEGRILRWGQSRWLLWLALGFVFVISPVIGYFVSPYHITIGFGLEALGAGILILQARREGWWEKVLSIPVIVLVGTWSYSLYLWQQLFLTDYNQTLTGQWPLSLVCAVLCAVTSFYCIEKPVLRWKEHFVRSRLEPRHHHG